MYKKKSHYKVWFNEGLHAIDGWHRMSDSKQHYIMYNIYHPNLIQTFSGTVIIKRN